MQVVYKKGSFQIRKNHDVELVLYFGEDSNIPFSFVRSGGNVVRGSVQLSDNNIVIDVDADIPALDFVLLYSAIREVFNGG